MQPTPLPKTSFQKQLLTIGKIPHLVIHIKKKKTKKSK